VLYGATGGLLFAGGQAGERFAVRNAGAHAVVEGCGSNGCEYMTAGVVVILGAVGDNFAAGMTGGMAFLYDQDNALPARVTADTVVYQRLASRHWEGVLKGLVEAHVRETQSPIATSLLANWDLSLAHMWQVCPKEMLSRLAHPLTEDVQQAAAKAGE